MDQCLKNGDKTILSNYRRVSLLPAMSKIFEKIVYNQLYQYFDSNNFTKASMTLGTRGPVGL